MAEEIENIEETSVLDQITTKPQPPGESSVSVNDIYTYVPEMSPYEQKIYEEQQRREGVPALKPLPHETMFPSASNQINKGSYSGSEIGSMPIFAAGGLMPFGVFDARQRAIEDASLKKAKQIEDFQKIYKAPITKHSSVQGKIDEGYYTGLRQWVDNSKKKYGAKWTDALNQDVSFQKWNKSWNTVKQMEDTLVDYAAQLEVKDKDPNFVLSPNTKKTMMEFMQGVDGLASNPFDPKGHTLNSKLLKLRAEDNLDTVVNTSVDKLIQDVKTSYPGTSDQGIYDLITTEKITGTDQKKIDALADSIVKTHYGDGSYFTKKDVLERLNSIIGTKKERTVSTHGNQFNPDSGDGAGFKYTNNDFSDEPQEFNATISLTKESQPYTTNAKGEKVYTTTRAGQVVTTDGITFKKPITVTVPVGASMINLEKGLLPSKTTGVKDIKLGKSFIAPLYFNPKDPKDPRNGSVVGKDQMEKLKADGYVVETPMVSGTYMGKSMVNGKEVEKEVSVSLPMNEVENSLVKEWNADGTVKTGIPVDIYKQKADKKNAQFNTGNTYKMSNGESYTAAELKAAGYTDEQIQGLK